MIPFIDIDKVHGNTRKKSDTITIPRAVAEEWFNFYWDKLQNGNGTTNENNLHKAIKSALGER